VGGGAPLPRPRARRARASPSERPSTSDPAGVAGAAGAAGGTGATGGADAVGSSRRVGGLSPVSSVGCVSDMPVPLAVCCGGQRRRTPGLGPALAGNRRPASPGNALSPRIRSHTAYATDAIGIIRQVAKRDRNAGHNAGPRACPRDRSSLARRFAPLHVTQDVGARTHATPIVLACIAMTGTPGQYARMGEKGCAICLRYMLALYACAICLRYMLALYACAICLRYMLALYAKAGPVAARRGPG